MSDWNAFLDDYEGYFPPALLARYEPIGCLADKDYVKTFELLDRETGDIYVAKAYLKSAFDSRESSILHTLDHPGIPRMAAEYDHDGTLFVVRAYIVGATLEEIVREAPLGMDDVTSIMLQLCDIVAYLHGQQPPIVHRDIKPSNIVIGETGRVALIDFETSRRYDETSQNDTVAICTLAYAAPEQFGYSQTDERSDIYSMGIVLLYLLTGETDRTRVRGAVRSPMAARIIRRCIAFAPGKRYQHVSGLRRALLRLNRRTRVSLRRVALVAALCLVFACGGFLAGFSHAARQAPNITLAPAAMTFEFPIIEEAVRLSLGKEPDETIYASELTLITGLYIDGTTACKTPDDFWLARDNTYKRVATGSITNLNDLRLMPNLREIYISNQHLEDISGIASLHNLLALELSFSTMLSDISPLAGLTTLRELTLFDSPITDISALEGLTNLLDLALVHLYIDDDDIMALSSLTNLRYLAIGYSDVTDLRPLLGLENLEQVAADDCPIDTSLLPDELPFALRLSANEP